MKIGRLHILTDTTIQSRFDHVELAERAIRGGADVIQFRQKSGTTLEMIAAAKRVRVVCRRAGVPLIVNDRIDVAIAADADGVHLGRDDFPIRLARQLLGPTGSSGARRARPRRRARATRRGRTTSAADPSTRRRRSPTRGRRPERSWWARSPASFRFP